MAQSPPTVDLLHEWGLGGGVDGPGDRFQGLNPSYSNHSVQTLLLLEKGEKFCIFHALRMVSFDWVTPPDGKDVLVLRVPTSGKQ